MKKENRRKLTGWLACVLIALAICAAVILYEKEALGWQFPEIARMASDGCFASGVMFTSFGVLILVSSFGGFSAIGYGIYLLTRIFSPSRARFEERKTYLEYCQSRDKKEKAPKNIFVTGIVFLALSVVWLGIYYM